MTNTFFILLGDRIKLSLSSRRALFLAAIFFLACLLTTKVLLRIQAEAGTVGFRLGLASVGEDVPVFLLQAPVFSLSVFFGTLFALPFLVLLLRHDIPAREMEEGTLRFLTWRVGRSGLVLSRYLAGVIEVGSVTLSGFLASWLWASVSSPGLCPVFPTLAYHLEAWLRQFPYLGALVACALFLSTLSGRSRRTLGFIILVGILFLVLLHQDELAYLSPFRVGYLTGLFSSSGDFLKSLLIYLAFNLVFVGGAVLAMKRKDL